MMKLSNLLLAVFNAEIAKQDLNLTIGFGDSTLTIDPNAFLQTIDGFGACFNEF